MSARPASVKTIPSGVRMKSASMISNPFFRADPAGTVRRLEIPNDSPPGRLAVPLQSASALPACATLLYSSANQPCYWKCYLDTITGRQPDANGPSTGPLFSRRKTATAYRGDSVRHVSSRL